MYALTRQTALLLIHYGVRCAHLHLRHNLGSLPGLAAALKASAEALEAAYQAVEKGKLQDHPKQETLQKTLTSMAALQPVYSTASCCKGYQRICVTYDVNHMMRCTCPINFCKEV